MTKNHIKILIDNGHGVNTPGKRSPDGRLLEWSYTREIARRVVAELQVQHYYASLLVPEEEDIMFWPHIQGRTMLILWVIE